MKVTIPRSEYEKILAEARRLAPVEACGLVAGADDDGVRRIVKAYVLTNVDHAAEHFSLDPKEQLAVVRRMRAEGLKPLGNWHSHPVSPSRPSEEDKRLSYDSAASYLILSLADAAHPVLNAFHVEKARNFVRKEELEIVDGD